MSISRAAPRASGGSGGLQEGDGLRCEALAAAGESQPVGRRRADVDAVRLEAEGAGEDAPHLLTKPGDSRLLADEHAVGVDEGEACLAHLRVRAAEQVERVGAPPAVVARREEPADVAESRCAQYRVGESV